MPYRKSYLKTGKLICAFVEYYEKTNGVQPTWLEIAGHLTTIDHQTKQGGPWRQSSAQHALVRYCDHENIEYPLRQRRGAENNPRSNEIVITLKIRVGADQTIRVVID